MFYKRSWCVSSRQLVNCPVLRFRSVFNDWFGSWLVAPPSLPSSLPHSLSLFLSLYLSLSLLRQNGVHGIARSLAHVIATFVLSRLVSNRE